MGGVFSSVRDLARWVAGFLDAFPARDDPEGDHPLRRASRREMQQGHRLVVPSQPVAPGPRARSLPTSSSTATASACTATRSSGP